MKLDKYRGKPLITVNVASHCGFANSNYRKRKELQKIFKDEELVVAAFPYNQFGSQEPGCGVAFKEDVKEKYQNKPDIYDKIEVNGENAHPLYNFLKKQSGSFGNKIKWNFTKFLVEENGHSVKLYAPTTSPMAIKHDIKSLIYGISRNIASNSNRSFATMPPATTIYDFTVKDADGKDISLEKYRGKPVVIVNVASECGLTNSNYTELKQLMEHYKDKGLAVAAFPCNQFGGQEPKCELDVKNFVAEKFHFEPDLYAKIDVNGKNTAPLFDFLKHAKGGLFGDNIKWNFTKFLIDQEGHPVKRYAPTTSPKHMMKDIDDLLKN